MNNNYYQSPKSSTLMRMFWRAAGADQYLLERSTYSDQIKYFCLGGIVVATGVMAALAGGYAIYTIFEPKGSALDGLLTAKAVKEGLKSNELIHFPTLFIAIAFGLVWGLIIYNIDRFIVTSTGKGDGTEAITKQEFVSALPRIIMGLIIAITISKPIEIRMFQTEINVKLKEKQIEQQTAYILKTKKNFKEELDRNANDLKKYEKDIQNKIARHKFLESQYIEEARIITVGPRALALKSQMDKVDKEIRNDKQNDEYLRLIKEKKDIQARLDKELIESHKTADGLDGLLERIKLSHEVAGFWISLFITLLFMVIELTPIFFKMMLIKGPYDYMDENIKELARAESGIEVIYNYYEDAQGMEAHKVVNHAAELKRKEKLLIIQAQEELNEKIIQNWKEDKLKDIEQNPNKYITEK
uniref:DUF4407 domain-containing protein n=1 Tax=Fluviicola sp. TaxID=1917219 RepID=UPI004049303A